MYLIKLVADENACCNIAKHFTIFSASKQIHNHNARCLISVKINPL